MLLYIIIVAARHYRSLIISMPVSIPLNNYLTCDRFRISLLYYRYH